MTAPRRLDASTQREELLFALRFLRQWGRESGPAPLPALQQHLAPALQLPLAPVLSALRFAGLVTLHTSPPAAETSAEGNLAALEWSSSPAHGRLATALQHLSSYDLGADRSGSVDLLFQQSSSKRPLLTERTLVATGPASRLWRAVHPRLGQALAIKQLWPAFDANARARFVQAQTAHAGLDHPSIVPLYDLIDTPDELAVVRPFSAAGNITPLLGTLAPTAAAQLLVQLLAALAYAHERSVVHGALVPANVLCDGAGGFRVTDFGAAPHVEGSDAGYRAPELRVGQSSSSGDMYAAGRLFLRALAPVSAGSSAPPLPTGLWPVVESLTAADPTRRMTATTALEALLRAGQPFTR